MWDAYYLVHAGNSTGRCEVISIKPRCYMNFSPGIAILRSLRSLSIAHTIHGAGILMLAKMGYIDGIHVTIYSSTVRIRHGIGIFSQNVSVHLATLALPYAPCMEYLPTFTIIYHHLPSFTIIYPKNQPGFVGKYASTMVRIWPSWKATGRKWCFLPDSSSVAGPVWVFHDRCAGKLGRFS